MSCVGGGEEIKGAGMTGLNADIQHLIKVSSGEEWSSTDPSGYQTLKNGRLISSKWPHD